MSRIYRGNSSRTPNVVHWQDPSYVRPEAYCRNGSYNIVMDDDKSQVTCPACLDKMRRLGTDQQTTVGFF